MTVVTPDFVQRMIRDGPLTKAMARARDGTAHPKNKLRGERFSSWALICEEALDTEHDAAWYDDIVAELARRGFSDDQIDRMRRFAWETAGWMNFDKMLWEWVSLDEKDIRTALDFQLKDGLITRTQYDERLCFIENPSRIWDSTR
jgi:hypothetical protein